MENGRNEYHVPALEKGLTILEYLAGRKEAKLSVICEDLGISKTTVFSILKNLEDLSYVRCADGVYSLTYKLYGLGTMVKNNRPYEKEIEREISRLSGELGETINFVAYAGRNSILSQKVSGPGVTQFLSYIGEIKPLHLSGVGKAILAYLPEDKLDKYLETPLESRTSRSISNPDLLRKTICEIREKGFAVDDEEGERGVYCIGVPIFNCTGEVCYGLSVSLLKTDRLRERLEKVIISVIAAGERISSILGYSGQYPMTLN